MLQGLRRLLSEWRGLQAFRKIERSDRRIVIYSEGRGYWTYFEPVVEALKLNHAITVHYLTSAVDDPLLLNPRAGMRSFYIGEGSVRTLFFATLDVDVLLMTMPDLHTFHIKRSPLPVHYAYLHHSVVSTHMIYRAAAFDNFDSIFCVGPHHVQEIRARERSKGLPAKTLVEHGYGRLDTIRSEGAAGPRQRRTGEPIQVLVAPTWGENGLIEKHGLEVIKSLMESGLRVVLRPHPRTRKLASRVLEEIVAHYRDTPLFSIDEEGDARTSLHNSDIMVSDWSGAALEFAFGLERPVIFADVPRKVLNPDYSILGVEPLEVQVREQLGVVIPTTSLPKLGDTVITLDACADKWQTNIRAARERWVFNAGCSGEVAARHLAELVK